MSAKCYANKLPILADQLLDRKTARTTSHGDHSPSVSYKNPAAAWQFPFEQVIHPQRLNRVHYRPSFLGLFRMLD
jgi:hypothetical protein